MKKVLLVANWKMHSGFTQGYTYIQKLYADLLKKKYVSTVVVCPDFVTLPGLSHFLDGRKKGIQLGAQDSFYELKGTFTGEVSPQSLKELGCTHVILGHSERRMILNESSEIISKKIKTVLKTNLIPIVCVGEQKILSQTRGVDFLEK